MTLHGRDAIKGEIFCYVSQDVSAYHRLLYQDYDHTLSRLSFYRHAQNTKPILLQWNIELQINQLYIWLKNRDRSSYTERTNLHCTIKILKEQSSFGTIKIKGKREMGEDINVRSDLFHQRQSSKAFKVCFEHAK